MHPTPATLIRLTRLTDTSLIVHWFTPEHGLLKTVAKGARRPASPFRGQLDLFFGAEILFSPARQGDLHSLREVAVRRWREGLRRDYTTTLLAGYFCQLLEAAVEPGHPEPLLHDLLERALEHLDRRPPSLRALRHFESQLAETLGVAHPSHPAETSLEGSLGRLPATRAALIERLPPGGFFPSSDPGNGR